MDQDMIKLCKPSADLIYLVYRHQTIFSSNTKHPYYPPSDIEKLSIESSN